MNRIVLEGFKSAMEKDAGFDLDRFILNAKAQARLIKRELKKKSKKKNKK